MNIELLRSLTEAHGVPGQEAAIREIVSKELKSICDLKVDSMGNLHAVKAPTRKAQKPKKLMIAAHMDEIGFIVRYVDDKGFLRIQPLGGWDPRQMNSQRVLVHSEGGPYPGVLMHSTKPKHQLKPEEMNQPQSVEQFFVDLGWTGEEASTKVHPGDMVTMNRGLQQMGPLLTCKAMDDRVGVFVMIEALKAAKSHQVEVHAVSTVQEEIGLRGASASGSAIAPDIVVALDITIANDIPGISESDHVTQLGKGTAIKFMDSSLLCHPGVVRHFRELAEEHSVPYQIEILPMGGTDAGGIQRLHGGIPAFTLSIPTRYVHTVNETVHQSDVQASIDLLARYIEDAHARDYQV
jgi:endoglucanase